MPAVNAKLGNQVPNHPVAEVRMKRQPRGHSLFGFSSILCTMLLLVASGPQQSALAAPSPGQAPGSLAIVGKDGKIQGDCPLKHTDVQAEITGFLARVTVTQEFENTSAEKVEAVYTFPLPPRMPRSTT